MNMTRSLPILSSGSHSCSGPAFVNKRNYDPYLVENMFLVDGKYHDVRELPAYRKYDEGKIIKQVHYQHGVMSNSIGYAYEEIHENIISKVKVLDGKITEFYQVKNGSEFRGDGSDLIINGNEITSKEGKKLHEITPKNRKEEISKHYHPNGKLSLVVYTKNGVIHRTDGPAMISYYEDGLLKSKKYMVNGKLHRDRGPAWVKVERRGFVITKKELYYRNNEIVDPEGYLI